MAASVLMSSAAAGVTVSVTARCGCSLKTAARSCGNES